MRILIASPIDPTAIELLRERHDVVLALNADEESLRSLINDREVLIFRSGVNVSAGVLAAGPGLKLLVRAGAGLDNIALDYVRERELRLVTIPGPGARAVAELTFALMLALARQVLVADKLLRRGRWAKYELKGSLLAGKRLGIVGAGSIGSRVGELGGAWDMEVIGCVEYPSQEEAARLGKAGIRLTDFDEVTQTADFVTVHVPLQPSTRYLINADVLSQIKPGAFLTNLARGGVLDEQALYHALTADNKLAGAALDVHEREGEGAISPLAELPNVILTPHIGAMATDAQRQIGERVIELVDACDRKDAVLETG